MSFDRHYGWLLNVLYAIQSPVYGGDAIVDPACLEDVGGHLLDVGSGDEHAGNLAGEDDSASSIVRIHLVTDRVEFGIQIFIQRVHRRLIEEHRGHRARALQPKESILCHRFRIPPTSLWPQPALRTISAALFLPAVPSFLPHSPRERQTGIPRPQCREATPL